jgi:hypothetical protein
VTTRDRLREAAEAVVEHRAGRHGIVHTWCGIEFDSHIDTLRAALADSPREPLDALLGEVHWLLVNEVNRTDEAYLLVLDRLAPLVTEDASEAADARLAARAEAGQEPLDVERLTSTHQLEAEQQGWPIPFAPCTCHDFPPHQHAARAEAGQEPGAGRCDCYVSPGLVCSACGLPTTPTPPTEEPGAGLPTDCGHSPDSDVHRLATPTPPTEGAER